MFKRMISLSLTVILAVLLFGCSPKENRPTDYTELSSNTSVTGNSSTVSDGTSDVSSEDTSSSVGDVSSEVSNTSSNSVNTSSVTAGLTVSTGKYGWNLVLVNNNNYMQDGYVPEVVQIKSRYADEGYMFDARAVESLNGMCDAAASDGISLWVSSAYRKYSSQVRNYNNEVAAYKANNPGCTDEEAKREAGKSVAVPGTSEHTLGLAVDFWPIEESFEDTAQFDWLQDNAANFGFILRYPKEKQSITNIIYEPWHYRYVGVEQAKKINSMGYCLEEYIDYLEQQ